MVVEKLSEGKYYTTQIDRMKKFHTNDETELPAPTSDKPGNTGEPSQPATAVTETMVPSTSHSDTGSRKNSEKIRSSKRSLPSREIVFPRKYNDFVVHKRNN